MAKVRYVATQNSGAKKGLVAPYLNHNIKGVKPVAKKPRVNSVPTEEEKYYFNILIDMYRNNGYVLPSQRQMSKNSMMKADDLLRIIGKGQGWPGVLASLKREIERRSHIGNMPKAEFSGKKDRKKAKPNLETTPEVKIADEPKPEAVESTAGELKSESTEPISSKTEPVESAKSQPEPVELVNSEPEVMEPTKPAPKKRGPRARSTPEEELKKLVHYYKMLGNKVPGQYDLQNLARRYPGEIRSYMTLVRYLGPQSGWAALIDDYWAQHQRE